MKLHLISYGDIRYKVQREFLKETALISSFFDEVRIFSNEDIDPEFRNQFSEIFRFHRGGGYMIWKPYFLKKMMANIADDDILIYCDAGCMINDWGKERFDHYIAQLITSETGIIAFELPLKEYEYTKEEVFEHFDCSELLIDSNQLMSGVILIKKTPHSNMLIDRWFRAIYENPWLFTDELTPEIQHPDFIAHRHDQSIFSVLLKTYGADILPDETYFTDFLRDGHAFPFWATRMGYFD